MPAALTIGDFSRVTHLSVKTSHLRRVEADLVAQVRQELGTDHMGQLHVVATNGPIRPGSGRGPSPPPAGRQPIGGTGCTDLVVRRAAPLDTPPGRAPGAKPAAA